MKHRKNVSSRQKRKLLIIFVGIIGVMFFLQGFVAIFLLLFLPDNSTTAITNQSTSHVASLPFQFHPQWQQQHQQRQRQRSPILPLEYVWKQYQQFHSQDSLQANRHNRSYQVIYYSCPYAAGNLFHDTINQMIVAIALNRTMLWKYNDEIACNATRKGYGGLICLKANTERDCEQSLIRSSWLPRYDDWKGILFPKNQKLPVRKPENYINSDWWGNNRRLLVSSAPFVYQTTAKQLLGSHNAYYLKEQNYSQIILEKLFSSGPDVLFGMLFRETFTFATQIIPPEYNPRQYIGHKTYAIHSRHFNTKSDGSNIKKERECLISMLDGDFTTTTTTKPCTIFLLSDRTLTIDILTSYIKGRWEHCTPVVATHVVAGMGSSRNNDGHYLEHGVYAGTGFFQDLMVASQARDGFIGHCYRTSSQLLKEFIEYDRTMEALDDTGNPPSHDLPVCCLPSAIAQE